MGRVPSEARLTAAWVRLRTRLSDLVAANVGSNTVTVLLNVLPAITDAKPGTAQVGRTVDIMGTDFAGAVEVTFGGTPAHFRVLSGTEITAKVPDGALTGSITVTTSILGTGDSVMSFRVRPSTEGFRPGSGPIGTAVTIEGWAFTGTMAVTFNGVSAAFTVDDYHHITAIVPVGAATGPISITTPGGTVQTDLDFTIT